MDGDPELAFDTVTGDSGIIFSNTMTVPSGFSGSNLWIQVCYYRVRQLQDSGLLWHIETENGPPPFGDAPIPYGAFLSGVPADEPNLPLPPGTNYLQGVAGNNFEMWMMFQPSNGIPVPLRAVNWSWSGSATNGVGDWSLVTGTNSVNPSDFDTEAYPTWNSDIRDEQWIPAL